MGNPERTQIELNTQAEALLNGIVKKALVLKEGEKIPVLSGGVSIESTGDYGSYNSTHYSLFLTREGLIKQTRSLKYISAADGFPYSEDETEYSVKPSYFLVQQYDVNQDDLKALEELLHRL